MIAWVRGVRKMKLKRIKLNIRGDGDKHTKLVAQNVRMNEENKNNETR